jgi:hypothetical protein
MSWWEMALLASGGQLVMWLAVARLHYRHFGWSTKVSDEDQQLYAGFWGFMWPLTLLGWGVNGLLELVIVCMTAPSLSEARSRREEQRVSAQADRCAKLASEVKRAEDDMRRADAVLTAALESGEIT